jgi:hypothetical protein
MRSGIRAAWALTFAIAAVAAATPAFGDGPRGSVAGAAARTGAAAAQPRLAPRGSIADAAARVMAGQPPPAPPFQRPPGHVNGHRHDQHRPAFVFIEPPFFGTRRFGYPYTPYAPYNPYVSYSPYSFYAWDRLSAYPAGPSMITAPYYCWVDGIGFSDEGRFAHHLHEVHGVPLDKALASSELLDGHYVFFGY